MYPIADAHCDYLSYHVIEDKDTRLFDHADLDGFLRGGVALQVFAVWVPPEHRDRLKTGFKQIEHLYSFIEQSGGRARLCTKAAHLNADSLSAVLSIESGDSIDCSLDAIEKSYDMGARMMSLTWNGENAFASGCGSVGGLKPLGKEALSLIDSLGMALDLSHINEQGFWESLETYSGTPCASHSSAYALCPAERNLNDAQIKALIERGGYIGINFYTEFLRGRSATIDNVLLHIEHILSLGGEDVVGFGSDFCGIQYTPQGIDSVADFQALPKAMLKRGYADSLIKKICYGNFATYILKFLR